MQFLSDVFRQLALSDQQKSFNERRYKADESSRSSHFEKLEPANPVHILITTGTHSFSWLFHEQNWPHISKLQASTNKFRKYEGHSRIIGRKCSVLSQ